jgi:glutathione S-transferase
MPSSLGSHADAIPDRPARSHRSMKLYYSQNSPYARIARIAAIESGIANQIEHVEVVNRSPDNPLLLHSPVCRVPTLVHDDMVLGEAKNICAYFDHIVGQSRFFARTDAKVWRELAFESMVVGFLEGIACWIRENRRAADERSSFLLEVERQRVERCLDHFQSAADRSLRHWNFCGIALACALGAMEFHCLLDGWNVTRPTLAAWYRDCSGRSSMVETRPI